MAVDEDQRTGIGRPEQPTAPYLDAVWAYAFRGTTRFHVPGHKGGPGSDPGLLEALGPAALALDIPALTEGVDTGGEPPRPSPVPRRSPPRPGERRARGSW